MMKLSICIITGVTLILGTGISVTSVYAQDVQHTVDKYSCKEIMRENGADRDAAIAFIHG